MSDVEPIPGLDGARRQQVAAGLWRAWRDDGRGAAVLIGFSGVGKTEQVIRPLIARAISKGSSAVHIEVPRHPTDIDQELTALLVEELRFDGQDDLAEATGGEASFSAAVGCLLRHSTLVVLDEFQRVLDGARGQPLEPLATSLQKIARRPPDKGCLWLVSNREVDPVWTEPFYTALLEPPSDLQDLQRIVLESIARADAEERFPADRRLEVVRRLGSNPRVLRLLGHLLRHYALEELLGLPGDVPEAPVDPRFTEEIERSLLKKAEEGLSNAAGVFLRELSVLREPGQWKLLEAMGGHLGDVRDLARQLRERYLLEIHANRYHLHPLVREVEGPRLRRDAEAWQAAHRRAGSWYAGLLHAADTTRADDAKLALHLAGARYHLVEAQAFDELREVMAPVRTYIEHQYGWTARNPANAAEREAKISLLDLYLEEPGTAGIEFQFAKLLKQRAAPGDLSKALPHARRATVGQDFSHPWVLWIQLVREVEGLDAAVTAARAAAEHVAPTKSLYSVYQFLGACLIHMGRAGEAIDALLEGAERADGNEERLVEEALHISAGEVSNHLLQRVRDWAAERRGLEPNVVFGDVLLHERQGSWTRAAEAAQNGRSLYPTFIHLAVQEALCWLGAGNPTNAQDALDRYPGSWRHEARGANTWLEASIALHQGNLLRASELLATYLDASAPTTEAGIRASLLREWDHRVATIGEPNPALEFPILPPTITGLEANVLRPQYGPPILPQHRRQPHQRPTSRVDVWRILAVGTEWHSGHGGLSTFNRQLCGALAGAGVEVVCLVLDATHKDQGDAETLGVKLVEATPTPGQPRQYALSRKPRLPGGFAPDVIIGHGRVTGPAARILVDDHFPEAKRLHFVHVAPDEIEWFKLDRDDDAGARAEERTQIELDLGRTADRVIAVGPRLYDRYLTELHPYGVPLPLRLDPGFDAENVDPRDPPPGSPWRVLLVGRLEDHDLKGIDLAAKAIGIAASRREPGADSLELVARGARPDTSTELYNKLREWSGYPGLRVVVRPFTTDSESLDADIKRASLLLMPSRSEGFGLVGLEAIVAGTPVLVSSKSGLGELLRETLEPQQVGRIVVRMSGDDEQDGEEWARAVEGMLRDREAAFRRATEMRVLLARQKTWAAAIAVLLGELREMLLKDG